MNLQGLGLGGRICYFAVKCDPWRSHMRHQMAAPDDSVYAPQVRWWPNVNDGIIHHTHTVIAWRLVYERQRRQLRRKGVFKDMTNTGIPHRYIGKCYAMSIATLI